MVTYGFCSSIHETSEDKKEVENTLPNFPLLSYLPASFVARSDKGLRVCDIISGQVKGTRRAQDDEEFRHVDPRQVGKNRRQGMRVKGLSQRNQPMGNPFRGKGKGRPQDRNVKSTQNKRAKRLYRPMGQWSRENKTSREWSIEVKDVWTVKQEILFNKLSLVNEKSKVETKDLAWCGEIPIYNKKIDKITPKASRPLSKCNAAFYNTSTTDDEVMEKLLQHHQAEMAEKGETEALTIACTDHILAVLMAASRSVASWDLRVTRMGNIIILDKRDESAVDFIGVNENARNPPVAIDEDDENAANNHNTPHKLAVEATCINQNFSQHALDKNVEGSECQYPNPFHDSEDTEAAKVAFRYRQITLPATAHSPRLDIIVRTEVSAQMPKTNEEEESQYVSVKALNEYIPGACYAMDWRSKLQVQEGALIATEIKNNSFKVARWVVEALLSGCSTLKLGFVSRRRSASPWDHDILGVSTFKTESLASQIGLKMSNGWGIIRELANVIVREEKVEDEDVDTSAGRFIFLKDPNEPKMRLYDVPWEEFSDNEEDSEDEDEDEDEEEEAEE